MKRLVIIGGSYGGLFALQSISALKLDLEIVLISPNSHFFYNISSPRVMVEIENVDKIFTPVQRFIDKNCKGKPRFIQGRVIEVDLLQKKILYEDKNDENTDTTERCDDEITYDYLVISSGTRGHIDSFQLNDNSHLDSITNMKYINSMVQSNSKIAIIGGGPTGVEIAGEIKGRYPEKEVTICGNKPFIVHSMGEKFSTKLVKKLGELGVKIVNGKQFDTFDVENKKVRFKDGDTLESDFSIRTTSRPNTEFLSKSPQHLNPKSFILVDEHLNLVGHENVWAIGDVLAAGGKNLYDITRYHVPYVVNCLKKGSSNVKPYLGPLPVIALPVYKNGGVGLFLGWNVPGWVVYLFKGRDYGLSEAQRHFS